jgi:SAM-dependent methyltransferase
MANTEFDQTYFERMAALEDRHPWTRSMRILTLDLLARYGVSERHSLLDAGCGTGLMLRDWRKRFQGGVHVGVDFAFPALLLARARTSARLACASASELPFPERSFDAVHSADVLQHMPLAGARAALQELHRVLRPGGLLALRVRATRLLIPTEQADYDHAYSPSSLRSQLAEAGFEVLFLKRVNLLPSLLAEVTQLIHAPREDRESPVKGIALRDSDDWRGRVMGAYLGLERFWLRTGGPGLPVGRTILTIARKR